MIDRVEYRGWKNNVRLSNSSTEVVVSLDVGPRVIAYRKPGGFNVMKNYDEMMGGTNEKEWCIRGGLRFWIAPEDLTRTYFPDNRPVAMTQLSQSAVRLTPPPEDVYGLQKVMELRLEEGSSRLHVRLRVTNIGQGATTLAPWAPTVMAPGGVEIIPLPAKANHPGSPSNAKHPGDFGPNQNYILWPYFDFRDERWTFGTKYIFLRQDRTKGPTKIGLAHAVPWVAYWNEGSLFVKRFRHQQSAKYPDMGTSYQTFSNEDMLEMETVGALYTLLPGESAELEEVWELFADVPAIASEADVDRYLLPLLGT